MNRRTFDLSVFESISETRGEKLVGGFSTSYSADGVDAPGEEANNCIGGNCITLCGSWQNIKCNTAVGCSGS